MQILFNRERYGFAIAEEKWIHRSEKRHKDSVLFEVQESMDRNDMLRFYETVNGTRHKTVTMPANDRDENLQTGETIMAAR